MKAGATINGMTMIKTAWTHEVVGPPLVYYNT